ncbi:pimeloyl-ACP methyl ester carboxylesterase [Sphingomonas xinjiangensis]|uniref:Pimeloyl-ACP methyl ester carboxylesterase n=1 Tax=Sphingomonas xinjiangensis TaxID=643568 RepID=A0A840YFF7_9SPHN|nr:alpha/beta hydrolase [Sphingomonas xinjiangensis]MBB5711035.1 pimeloyl-ACP methyl ester carboxylesterase [Sphingomonas xinjiangensis]
MSSVSWTQEVDLSLDGPLAKRHRARLVGNGSRVVVFSHGLGTDQSSWHAVLERLGGSFTAFLYDIPGASALMPEDFDPKDYRSIAAFADDLLALMDEVGITSCDYVGHSVSGMIGALASIEESERFRKLLLINASPRYLNDVGYVGGFEESDVEGLLAAMADNYQAWVAGFASAAVGVDVPAAVDDFAAGLLAMRPDVTIQIARAIFESDVRRLLPLVTVPSVLVHARGDIAVPEAVATYLRSHIEGSRLEWIGTPGHMPHLAAPDEIARVLGAHLA